MQKDLMIKAKKLIRLIQANLTDDLRLKKYRGHKNPLKGHCYVASEVLYHLLGGKQAGLKVFYIKHENDTHWFLKLNGKVLDPTAGQFETEPEYDKAKRIGFLTINPSKRAKILMNIIK